MPCSINVTTIGTPMIDRHYKCNFCSYEKPIDELIGIYYLSNHSGDIRIADVKSVENHICKPCARAIARLVNSIEKG
jgi:hypothetical protein